MRGKLLVSVLAAVLTIGALSGCGTSNGDSKTDSKAETESKKEENYEVVMQWPAVGDAPSGLSDVEAAVNEITSSEGITVRLEPVGAFDLANETSLAVSSGEKLDLCLSLYSGIGSLAGNGSIIELDDLITEYGKDITSICGERQMTGGLYNGKIYGVPYHYVDGTNMGMVLRSDLLEKYGVKIDPDKYYSMEELTDIFSMIKEGEGSSFYIFAGGFTTTNMLGSYINYDNLGQSEASGVLVVDDSGSTEIKNIFETSEFAEFADLMYQWNQAGFFSADAATTNEDSGAQVATGNYLGMFLSDAAGTTANTYTLSTGYDMTYIKTQPATARTSNYTSVLWSISSTSENPEKAMIFLNMLYKNPDLANLLQYGIEGVSYQVLKSDEHGTVIDVIDGETTTTVPYWQIFGVYGDRLSWNITAPADTTLNQELKDFSDSVSLESPALGYSFNIDNVSSQYSAVSSVVAQYLPILQTGSIDPAKELPEFLNALETAGIEEVIAENQNQFDSWLAQQ